MKTKFIYILLVTSFLLCSLAVYSEEEQKDITVTEPTELLQKDTVLVKARKFRNLKDTYSSKAFTYERTEASSGWWTRFKEWLNSVWKNFFNIDSNSKAKKITDIMLNIAAVIIVLLVVYFIYKAILNKEGKWVFGKNSNSQIIPITSVEHNVYTSNFKTLVETAEQEQNYRLAVRYYYLWLLKELSIKNVITYDAEKTNSDYQLEIENSPYAKNFSYASYLYNYIWYGEFNVDEFQFKKAKNTFTQFLKTIING